MRPGTGTVRKETSIGDEKMIKYDYTRIQDKLQLSELLEQYGDEAKIVAGGTDLFVQIHEQSAKLSNMKMMLDISSLEKEMKYIKVEDEELVIGALSTHTEIERSKEVQMYLPSLGVACSLVGSPQIRNLGTIGGSICNASLAADPVPPLLAGEAVLVLCKGETTRKLLLEEFFLGGGKTALESGEFLLEIRIPIRKEKVYEAFEKLGRRKALAISRLNAVVRYTLSEDGTIRWVRLVPGCVFAVPQRSEKAEALLMGKTPSKALFEEAGKAVSEEMIEKTGVRWSTAYKQPAIEGVIEKVLAMAAGIWEEM